MSIDYGNFLDTLISFILVIAFVMLVSYLTNLYKRRRGSKSDSRDENNSEYTKKDKK